MKDRILELHKAGKKQTEIAKELNISQSYVSQIISNNISGDISNITNISDISNIISKEVERHTEQRLAELKTKTNTILKDIYKRLNYIDKLKEELSEEFNKRVNKVINHNLNNALEGLKSQILTELKKGVND